MITPIKTMTINQIMERKDDVLISDEDIKEVARNVRNKAIDEFAERLRLNTSEFEVMNGFGEIEDRVDAIAISKINKIAEEMRGVE